MGKLSKKHGDIGFRDKDVNYIFSKTTQKVKNNNIKTKSVRVVKSKNSTTIQKANDKKVKTRSYRMNEDGTGTLVVSSSTNPQGRIRNISNIGKAQRKMNRVNKRAEKIKNG